MAVRDEDQEARIALMELYSSQLRHWGTITLSIAVGIFAVFSRDLLRTLIRSELPIWIWRFTAFDFALSLLVGQVCFAFIRMLWYGRKTEYPCKAIPMSIQESEDELSEVYKGPRRNYLTTTYLYRVDAAVERLIGQSCVGSFLRCSGRGGFYAAWTIVVTLVLTCLFAYSGIARIVIDP